MSQYIVLSKITLQNANSIAGFTWGFPAITHFLGFTHALSRKISNQYLGAYNTEFSGCMVIANQVNNKVYQPKAYADVEFLQSKTPPVLAKHKAVSPPIIEEGKLNATVSLVLEIAQPLLLTTEQVTAFEQKITQFCLKMRLAGGSVLSIGRVKLISANNNDENQKQLSTIKRLCMPGFVLQDRSEYLEKHVKHDDIINKNKQSPQSLFKAWLDFSAMKFTATPKLNEETEPNIQTSAKWQRQKKPFDGYLVPLMTGYKAIAKPYDKTEVLGLRVKPDPEDQDVKKVTFVETIHSVGEWLSMHRVTQLNDFIWRYHQTDEWYLCQQTSQCALNKSAQNSTHINTQSDITQLTNQLF